MSFNLPPEGIYVANGVGGPNRRGHVRHKQIPRQELEVCFGRRVAFFLGRGARTPPAGIHHGGREAIGDQAGGHSLLGAQPHGDLMGDAGHCPQEPGQLEAGAPRPPGPQRCGSDD